MEKAEHMIHEGQRMRVRDDSSRKGIPGFFTPWAYRKEVALLFMLVAPTIVFLVLSMFGGELIVTEHCLICPSAHRINHSITVIIIGV
jgi:hypothetical protein